MNAIPPLKSFSAVGSADDPVATPPARFIRLVLRSLPSLGIAIGASGTVVLFATGHNRQAWLGLVMLLTYAFATRWRTAGLVLAIPVITLVPFVGSVALAVPVLAGLAAESITSVAVYRRLPPRGITATGLAVTIWLAIVLISTNASFIVSGSRGATTVIVCLEVILAVLSARGVSASALVRSTIVTASIAGWVVTFTPGQQVFAGRHGGLGLNPNYIGLTLAVGMVAAGGLVMQHHYQLAVASAPGLLAGMAMSQSRAAVVSLAVGLSMILIARVGLPRTVRARLIAGAMVVAAVGGFALFSALRDGTWAQQSDDQRWGVAGLALRLTFSHPLVGIGWLNFPQFAASDPATHMIMNTHNEYLRLSAEGGVVAIVLWLLFLVSAFRRPTTPIRMVLVGSVVAWAADLLFVNGLAVPAVSLAPMLLLGALASTSPGPPITAASMVTRSPSAVPRRVMLCVGQLGLGGTERQVVLLAKGLVERHIDVHVVTLRGGPRQSDLLAVGARSTVLNDFPEGYKVRGIPMLVSSWRLLRILRKERPDVVHGYLLHMYILSSIVAKLAGVPVIATGRRSLGEYTSRVRPLKLVGRLSNGVTDAVVANAQSVAEDAIRAEGLLRDKVVTIHNAVPALDHRGGATTPHAEELVVVNVANLNSIKGQADIIEAAALLKLHDVRVHVQIIGEGPERPTLAALAQKLSVDLELVGHSTDVPRNLRRADVYVHASTEEGMSNSIMEAMAVGLPIVATDVGGASELLGNCGILVAPSDPQAIAQALQTIAEDRDHAAEMGAAARARALDDFSEDALVTRHLHLYGALMEQRCAE